MSLHAAAAAMLTAWNDGTADPAQRELAVRYLEFVTSHEDAMWRSCRPGHITASALVLSAAGDRTLLTLHPRVGRWLQLGGHCEPSDTSLLGAALREAREESGIESLTPRSAQPLRLDRHRVGCNGGAWHYDVQYVVVAPDGSTPRRSEESLDLRWFPVGALPQPTDAALAALVREAARPPAGT